MKIKYMSDLHMELWDYSKSWKEGNIYHFVLEVGHTHYRFEVERWLKENNRENAHVEYRLIDTQKMSISDTQMHQCASYRVMHNSRDGHRKNDGRNRKAALRIPYSQALSSLV